MSARLDEKRSADAYARGLWVHSTLADSLRDAALTTPTRTVLVDGDIRVDCRTLHAQSTALARHLGSRMPVGSVVSFMLPNWHEAAVIYHAATMAGMVVNPILPSLRDRELRFILTDARSRMIFVPSRFGGHDYGSMLTRVTEQMKSPPEVVMVRGDGYGPPDAVRRAARRSDTAPVAGTRPRRRENDPLHVGDNRPAERCSAHT